MESRIADAISLDIKFDQRLPKDVVFDGIKNGKRLTLPAFPHDFFSARLEIEGYSFLPFSNPNNSRVVLCNELGEFVTRQTDELGFYNPPGTWKDTSAIDVLLIGDSYTAGWCVPEGNSLADIVRASFKRTINIGRGGLGPLGELASMREYLPAIRPKFAVWAFFDNDFGNLHDEERHINLYNQYLIDDSFSQNLFENSGKINTAVTQYINIEIGKLNQRKNLPFVGIRHQIHGISDMIKNAKVTKAHWSSKREFPHHIALFRQIMESAKREAQKAETTLIFAYLSDYKPFKESKELKAFTKLRREVLRVVKELKIDFIDTNIAANMATKNVRSLHRWTKEYPTSLPSNVVRHYNSFGHQVVGLEIVRKLQSEFNLMHKGNK